MTKVFSYRSFPLQSLEYYKSKRKEFLSRKVECPHDGSKNCPTCAKASNAFIIELDSLLKNFSPVS